MIASICYTRADLLAPLGLQPAEFRVGDALMGTYVSQRTPVERRPIRVSTSPATSPTFSAGHQRGRRRTCRRRDDQRSLMGIELLDWCDSPQPPARPRARRDPALIPAEFSATGAIALCGENYDDTSGSVCR